jgi:hypothetical protein
MNQLDPNAGFWFWLGVVTTPIAPLIIWVITHLKLEWVKP